MDLKDVLIKPLITEKATQKLGEVGQYAFAVALSATKTEIKQAVEKFYTVKVTGINTVIYKGKTRKINWRRQIQQTDWKKALVKLAKGDKIDAFEFSEKEKELKDGSKIKKNP